MNLIILARKLGNWCELVLFDSLTDNERLKELSVNPVSENYVFCEICKKALSQYLESPYSSFHKNKQHVSAEIPLIFL